MKQGVQILGFKKSGKTTTCEALLAHLQFLQLPMKDMAPFVRRFHSRTSRAGRKKEQQSKVRRQKLL